MLQPQPTLAKLSNLSTDPDINSDANFLDDLQILLEKHKNTSKLSIPFMSQIRFANANFRRSVKKRTVFHKKQEKINSQTPVQEENLVQNEISTENVDNFEDLFGIEENSTNDQKPMPKVGEYWKIRFGSQSLFCLLLVFSFFCGSCHHSCCRETLFSEPKRADLYVILCFALLCFACL